MRVLIAIALTAASAWAIAQPAPAPPPVLPAQPATIQVMGQAEVSETPDRVYIDIGVTTQAQKSQEAAAQNAGRVATVIAAVRQAAGPSAQLTTTEYSVSPDYHYPRDGGSPTLVGYSVSNVVQVRLDDLRKIGPVIDAATQAGSNNVQNVRFALRDAESPRREALREAARNARQDAQDLAGALGLKVVRVLTVDEQGGGVRQPLIYPQAVKTELPAAPPPTPVEPGAIDVGVAVTLTVEVAPAKR
jgi:uncharacterized protein YggE